MEPSLESMPGIKFQLGLDQEGFTKDLLRNPVFATYRQLVHKGYCGWQFLAGVSPLELLCANAIIG